MSEETWRLEYRRERERWAEERAKRHDAEMDAEHWKGVAESLAAELKQLGEHPGPDTTATESARANPKQSVGFRRRGTA